MLRMTHLTKPVRHGARRPADAVRLGQRAAEWPSIVEAKDIAEEGFIYGLPIVMNYAVMYAYAVDKDSGQFKAPFNEIKNEARVFTYKDTASRHAEQRHALFLCLAGSARRAHRPVGARGREGPLLRGAARGRQYVQLRLYRQPRDWQRGWRLHGRGSRLAGRNAARHQEGIPVLHAVLACGLSHAALRPRRHRQREEGASRLQGAAAIGLSRQASADAGAEDRLPQDRQGPREEQLLRISRLRAAVRARLERTRRISARSSRKSASALARASTSTSCRSAIGWRSASA